MSKLEYYLEMRGMTLAELGRKARIKPHRLRQIREFEPVNFEEAAKISEVLETTISRLFVVQGYGLYLRERRRA